METVILPHLPQHPLRIGLFKHVSNSAFLRQQLLDGNTAFEYAFLDASVLLSRNHVLAACFKAINDSLQNRLRSRNVHSEIVFSLSPNNNIAESFRRFGISDETKHIFAIKVGGEASDIEAHLRENVKGELVDFTDEALAQTSDLSRIRKIYRADVCKIANAEVMRKEMEVAVLGAMALKGA